MGEAAKGGARAFLCEGRQSAARPVPAVGGLRLLDNISSRPETWGAWSKLAHSETGNAPLLASGSAQWTAPKSTRTVSVIQGQGSARVEENAEWQKIASLWQHCLAPLLHAAPNFCSLGVAVDASLLKVLMLKSSAALRQHLSGWKLWADFARDQTWFVGEPPEADLVGFLRALVAGRVA